MDFLKYGLEHEESNSRFQRAVARCLLRIEKCMADRYERRLIRRQIAVSLDQKETETLLAATWEEIKRNGLRERNAADLKETAGRTPR